MTRAEARNNAPGPMGKTEPTPPSWPTRPPTPPRRSIGLRVERDRAFGGILARMRIRKKLIVLHTCFSLGMSLVLLALLKPAVTAVVREAEVDEAKLLLRSVSLGHPRAAEENARESGARVESGSPGDIDLSPDLAARAAGTPGIPLAAPPRDGAGRAVMFLPESDGRGRYYAASVVIADARAAVAKLYLLTAGALLGVYALVAAALEFLVLPKNVYAPIARMLEAERAVQDGRADEELIPASAIPADELGEIMRSRNASILSLRNNEAALASALGRLEEVATDLKRKNHLLETAQRNLADADRLASLGMMSAGIAHELNTPLAVVKGLVEKLQRPPKHELDPGEAALLLRVVARLERLSESLLDFARARPPHWAPSDLAAVVAEAVTLVRLDRQSAGVAVRNLVPAGTLADCDADRMVQVFVNLVRNAADALRRRTDANDGESPRDRGSVDVVGELVQRDGSEWISVRVIDDGPGIDPGVLPRLFEPFASTRLDARGTGLGLAVSDGIVREHGGVILARNRTDRSGSIFEVVLPRHAPPATNPAPTPRADARTDEPRLDHPLTAHAER